MKQRYSFTCIGLLSLFALLNSCNLINPAEPVPSYIQIEAITLETDYNFEGSNSSKISDAWIYIDGKLQGCYELPVTFPVIAEGSHQIIIRAGIRVNGISATRAPYPFYQQYVKDINLTRGEILTMSPVVTYVDGLNFEWREDFEGTGITLTSPPTPHDTIMYLFAPPASSLPHPFVFEGNGSGISKVDNTYLLCESASNEYFTLPKGDSPVFLEFNYKCNYSFTVGMYAQGPSGTSKAAVLNFNPSNVWNKTYVYLSPAIGESGNATDFKIFFGILNNAGADSLGFALDNVKLIHF